MNKKNLIIISIIVLVVVAGLAFYGGMFYAKNQSASTAAAARASFAGLRGSRPGTSDGGGGGIISGTILSNNGSTIALQLPTSTGGSKIILFSTATQISKTKSGTSADLAVGATVSVMGTTNADGSITANTIQIRPVPQAPVQ